MYLHNGDPYHVMNNVKGVAVEWAKANERDRIYIHNGKTIKEYEYLNGEWHCRSIAYVK